MSHVHVPDGVLPLGLWGSAWALAVVLLAIAGGAMRGARPQRIAFQGALGALALVAMALEIPLGPLEYHLTLLGPLGVLLGPAAAFQVLFVVSAMLAFAGHGGFTVIGINALVLGSGAALARPLYRAIARGAGTPRAMAAAAGAAQAIAGMLWLAVMSVALRARAWTASGEAGADRFTVVLAIALPVWVAGVVVESVVAFGLARFLVRVRPDLLPALDASSPAPPAGEGPGEPGPARAT